MTKNKVLIPALFLIMFAGFMQLSYALPEDKPTTLEQKCAEEEQPNKPLSPDCELLKIIKDLEDELKEKDMQLMDKDDALMSKDGQLMNSISNLKTETIRLCDNVPLFRTGLDIVSTVTLNILGSTNTAINAINSVLTTLKNLSLDIPIPEFTTPKFIPTVSVGSTSFDVCPGPLDCDITIPTISVGTKTITFNIPDPSITPFGFISTIPTIPPETFVSIQTVLDSVEECDPGNLSQI